MSWNLTSPTQKAVLRAMATLGEPASLPKIVNEHDITRVTFGTIRALISRGLVCSAGPLTKHGPMLFELTKAGWNYVEVGYAGKRPTPSLLPHDFNG